MATKIHERSSRGNEELYARWTGGQAVAQPGRFGRARAGSLGVGTFFFVQALGGFEKVIALLGQGQALGQRMRDLVEQTGAWAPVVYVAAKALIFIFVPWLGYPLNVAAGALFGLFWGVIRLSAIL